MPIANCYINIQKPADAEAIVNDWSDLSNVDAQYITLNFFTDFQQAGKKYSIMVHLFLPTIWTKKNVKEIQLALLKTLSKHFKLTSSEIFIMTSVIGSENVVEDGVISSWDDNYNS